MARIEYTGLVSQIRGKIAGTVFSKFQGGYSAYRKGSPRKQGSQAQQLVRNYFYAFASAWKTLTETQRNDWRFVAANTPLYDRLGILRPINGFAYFVKFNQFLAGFMATPQIDVTTDLEPAYPTSVAAAPATFSISPTGWILDDLEITLTTLGNSVYPNLALIYFSQPIPYNDIVYHGTWYKAAAIEIAANMGSAVDIVETLSAIVMPAGFRSFSGAIHRLKVELIAVDSAQFAATSLTDTENEPEPPATFPTLAAYQPDGENMVLYLGAFEIFWSLFWERTAGTEDPELYEILLSAQIAATSTADPATLSYLTMGTFALDVQTPFTLIWPFLVSRIEDSGPNLLNAFSGSIPAPTGSNSVFLRYQLRHIASSDLGPVLYQRFNYGSI
jgi:hypothetical protein